MDIRKNNGKAQVTTKTIIVDILRFKIKVPVALLIMGSAILLFSCDNSTDESEQDNSRLMTQQSENLTIKYTKEGKVTHIGKTPLVERYEYAKPEPYSEFRKGVYLETYNDTTQTVMTTITANYALWLEKQDLWEGKGNVVVTNYKGEKLETEQLFYNLKTKRIWSNVDSKISQGYDVSYGTGFESDDRMEEWEFRQPDWSVEVDNTQLPGAGGGAAEGGESAAGTGAAEGVAGAGAGTGAAGGVSRAGAGDVSGNVSGAGAAGAGTRGARDGGESAAGAADGDVSGVPAASAGTRGTRDGGESVAGTGVAGGGESAAENVSGAGAAGAGSGANAPQNESPARTGEGGDLPAQ